MLADGPSSVTLEGGTHNPWAPPFDFLERVYLPQLRKFGPRVDAELLTYGFYPAGGGRMRLQVQPAEKLQALELMNRVGKLEPCVIAIVSDIPKVVAERECDTIRRKSGWRAECFSSIEVEDPNGPGNIVMIELKWDGVSEIVTAHGKQGVKAEQVARKAYRKAKAFINLEVPVGEYLADQLLMPMGLAASQGATSSFRTGRLSLHSTTHLDVLKSFLEIESEVVDDGEFSRVRVGPRKRY